MKKAFLISMFVFTLSSFAEFDNEKSVGEDMFSSGLVESAGSSESQPSGYTNPFLNNDTPTAVEKSALFDGYYSQTEEGVLKYYLKRGQ